MNASSVAVFKTKEKGKAKEASKNTLANLNDFLFQSLERLSNTDINSEELEKEIQRSEAITKTANTIIQQGQLQLNFQKHMDEYGSGQIIEQPLFGITDHQLIEENCNLRDRVKKAEAWS